MSDRTKNALLFAGVPAFLFFLPHLFLVTGGYDRWIMPTPREIGYVENATAFFFLAGGLAALFLAYRSGERPAPLYRMTLTLYGLLAIWVCLEEVSYGQQFLHFSTPEWFLERNKNLEVNIHNLYGDALSYAMKTAGYAGIAIAGILAPLGVSLGFLSFRGGGWFHFFTPPLMMAIPSLFHLFANGPKTLLRLAGKEDFVNAHPYFSESGEYEEYMLGVWVILYVVALARRGAGAGRV